MNDTLTNAPPPFRLTFKSKMTFEFSGEIEDMILDALRRYRHVQVDLSKVNEIDICGVHLLGVLDNFADKGIEVIATSPAIKNAYEQRHNRLVQRHLKSSLEKQPQGMS